MVLHEIYFSEVSEETFRECMELLNTEKHGGKHTVKYMGSNVKGELVIAQNDGTGELWKEFMKEVTDIVLRLN